MSPPSSKCLHLLSGICFRNLHSEHSILRTIFFVVLAWKYRTNLLDRNPFNKCKQKQHNLKTYLLPKYRFCLTTKTLLFSVVTATSLRGPPFFRLLVLCHFMCFMLFAFFAKSPSGLRYVHLKNFKQ